MNTRSKIIAWAGAALLVATGTIGGIAIANPGAPAEEAPAKIVQELPQVTPTPTPSAPAAVVPEAPVEVVVEPPAPEPPYSNSGQQVPFYPSSDPENAGGGEYADPGSWCTSGSASTVGGVPVCD